MKTFICTVCGKEFEAIKNAKYCPSCRAAKYRENDRIAQRNRRAKIYEVENGEARQQAKAAQEERKRKFEEQEAKRIKKLQADADAGDLIARLSIARREKGHYYSINYWKAFQDYAQEQTSYIPGADYVVNDVSVRDPAFPQKVIASLKSGRIRMDWYKN